MNPPYDLLRSLLHDPVIPRPDSCPTGARRVETLIDPWHDYLAFPIAPLVLLVQIAGLFLGTLALRLIVLIVGPLLIGAMLTYVSSLSLRADEGVNIGQGLLVLWLLASFGVALLGTLLEGVRRLRTGRRKRPQ